jgi:hypothetical protein
VEPGELDLNIDPTRADLLDFEVSGAAKLSLPQPLVQIYAQGMLVGVLVEEVEDSWALRHCRTDSMSWSNTALAAAATSPVKSSHVESAVSMRLGSVRLRV